MSKKEKFMQGNQACAEGAIAAGVRFFAGYPITPSSEIAENMAKKLPEVGGKFIQMEDEIASMAAVVGASMMGVKSMTATSGPGFSLKQENLGYASMTQIPCVIVNDMRGGPSTGFPTAPSQGDVMQSIWGTHGDHPVIVLAASTVPEAYHNIIKAFNLAEKYMTPVVFLMDEIIAHMREKVTIPSKDEIETIERDYPEDPGEDYKPFEPDENNVPRLIPLGEGVRYHFTGLNYDYEGFPNLDPESIDRQMNQLMGKIEDNADDIVEYEEVETEDAEIIVFAYGSPARSARNVVSTLRREGIKVGVFKAVTLHPFPEKRMRELSKKVDRFVVPEMNWGQMIKEVERITGANAGVSQLRRVDTEPITPAQIIEKVKEVS